MAKVLKINSESKLGIDNYFESELGNFKYRLKEIIEGKNEFIGSLSESSFLVHCILSVLDTYNSTQAFKRNITKIIDSIKIVKANKKDDDFLICQTIHNLALDVSDLWKTYGDVTFDTINLDLLNSTNVDNFKLLSEDIKDAKEKKGEEVFLLSRIPFTLYDGKEFEMFKTSLDNFIKRTLLSKASLISQAHSNFMKTFSDTKYMTDKVLLDKLVNETDIVTQAQNKILRDIANSKEQRTIDKVSLDVLDVGFKDIINMMVNDTIRLDSKIKTRSIAHNQLLGGGFEKGGLYTYMGVTGGGKSNELFSLALDVIHPKINMFVTPKIPIVIYFSNENSNNKTMERLFSHQTGVTFESYKRYVRGSDKKIDSKTISDTITKAIHSGYPFTIPEEDKDKFVYKDSEGNERKVAHLKLRYISPSGVSANDINAIIEEYESEGYEVICAIVDYLSRLKPNGSNSGSDNMYLEKGKISNELRELAISKNITVITAVQANKDSSDMVANNKRLSKSNIAESSNITHNSDVLFHYKVDNITRRFATIESLKNRNVGIYNECHMMFDLDRNKNPNYLRINYDYTNPSLWKGSKPLQTSFTSLEEFHKVNFKDKGIDVDTEFNNPAKDNDLLRNIIKDCGLKIGPKKTSEVVSIKPMNKELPLAA